MQMYELGPDGRKKLGEKAKKYVEEEFNFQNTIDMWDETLTDLVDNWKSKYQPWTIKTL